MSTLDTRVTALLAKPSLEGLAYALEHPETWPAAYAAAGWHYKDCATCAMGLAAKLWPGTIELFSATIAVRSIQNLFQMGEDDAFDIFYMGRSDSSASFVADRIRTYLANHPHASRSGDAVVVSVSVQT